MQAMSAWLDCGTPPPELIYNAVAGSGKSGRART
jgi:hypothetical protein